MSATRVYLGRLPPGKYYTHTCLQRTDDLDVRESDVADVRGVSDQADRNAYHP